MWSMCGLSCRSAGRFTRHSMLNDLLTRACIRSGVPAVEEPKGLSPSDEKRSDGVSLVPWRVGRCIARDVTCPDTLEASHRSMTSVTIAAAAERAALLKHIKYAEIKANIYGLGFPTCLSSEFDSVKKRSSRSVWKHRCTVFKTCYKIIYVPPILASRQCSFTARITVKNST